VATLEAEKEKLVQDSEQEKVTLASLESSVTACFSLLAENKKKIAFCAPASPRLARRCYFAHPRAPQTWAW